MTVTKHQVTYYYAQGNCGEPGCCSWDESMVEYTNGRADENVGAMFNVDDLNDYLSSVYGSDWAEQFEVNEEGCSFYY